MLVLSNGAFKSGSTWLRAILGSMIRSAEGERYEKIPHKYRDPTMSTNVAWLDETKIDAFLKTGLHHKENYLSRGHIYKTRYRDSLIAHDDVYVVHIQRGIKDTLVSHYYHLIRDNKLKEEYAQEEEIQEGFNKYYWRLGRYKAQQLLDYHASWNIDSPRVITTSFEGLKKDFHAEVKAIGHFLHFDLSDEQINSIKQETSMKNMQKTRGQSKLEEHKRFFRKGAVGEWKAHFDDDIMKDLEQIQQTGLGTLGTVRYHLTFKALEVRQQLLRLR